MTDARMNVVEETLGHFRTIVAADGGVLAVGSLDGDELTVVYAKGVNERCQECVITHEDLAIFIQEALDVRSVGIGRIRVVDPAEEQGG